MLLVPQVYSYPLAHRGDSSPGATAGTAGDVDLNKYSLAQKMLNQLNQFFPDIFGP